jgi:hypothetical protein
MFDRPISGLAGERTRSTLQPADANAPRQSAVPSPGTLVLESFRSVQFADSLRRTGAAPGSGPDSTATPTDVRCPHRARASLTGTSSPVNLCSYERAVFLWSGLARPRGPASSAMTA